MKNLASGLSVSLLSLWLTACAPKTQVQHIYNLEDDCGLMRDTIVTTSEIPSEKYDELYAFIDQCKDYTVLTNVVEKEINNPDMEALMISTVFRMFAEKNPLFKKNLLKVLNDHRITEKDLIDRKEISDAIEHVKDTPEFDCVRVDNWRSASDDNQDGSPKDYQGIYPEDYYQEKKKHLICD